MFQDQLRELAIRRTRQRNRAIAAVFGLAIAALFAGWYQLLG